MPVEYLGDASDPCLADYHYVRDPALVRERGLLVAESREVVRIMLTRSRFSPRSLLVTEAALEAMGDWIGDWPGRVPIYVLPHAEIRKVVGFNVHRGCLALGERLPEPDLSDQLPPSPEPCRVVVLEGVSNPDNIGGVFRCAAAFGVTGVILCGGCADPLYRKSIRVSMGHTLRIPYATFPSWEEVVPLVRSLGLATAALTPDGASELTAYAENVPRRLALCLGNEGDGLSRGLRDSADDRVAIQMTNDMDSVNVALAAGIGLYTLWGRLAK